MGRDVYETSAAARATFDEADRVLGYKLSEVCFVGPAERLNDTTVAQPAVLATSIALFEAMVESVTHKIGRRVTDGSEPRAVEIAQRRGGGARQRAVHERLEQHRLEAVFAMVQRDQLVENGLGRVRPRPPAINASDLGRGATPQGLLDETLLRRCVQIQGARRHVCAPRDVGHAQRVVAVARDLA